MTRAPKLAGDDAPPRAKRRDLESPIQAAIVELIRVGYPSALVYSIPNGGFVLEPRVVAKLRWTGLLPGMPDLGVEWPGDHGFIETKAAKGTLSDDQRGVHKILLGMGKRVVVCRSVDEARAALDGWGVPSRINTGLAA